MWYIKQIKTIHLLGLVAIWLLASPGESYAQFNRFYPHDRDSINTSVFNAAIFHKNNEILAIKAAYEYHSTVLYQSFQYYLERFDLSGDRLEQVPINSYFPLDTTTHLFIQNALVKDPVEGYRFIASVTDDTTGLTIYSCWVSEELDNFNFQPVENIPMPTSTCGFQLGLLRVDPFGGYFFHLDFPDQCQFDYPGTNMIIHLDTQGELDWYRTMDDDFPYNETIMDIARHPTTGEIFYCGNEAYTAFACPNTPGGRNCEHYAFVYRCDAQGQNCTRIYHAQDTVDTYQECNFIKVLSDGNIAVSHPILETDIGRRASSGTSRMILMNADGVIQQQLISTYPYGTHKFESIFEIGNGQYYFIYRTAWEVPGNVNQSGQIYTPTYEVSVFQDETFLQAQGLYIPGQISINSEYQLVHAVMNNDQLLVCGNMLWDAENTFVPYMALSDNNGCFPDIPCTPVGIADVLASSKTEDLLLYPNPANTQITIELKEQEVIYLFDLRGSLVYQWQGQQGSHTYELATIPPGVYILQAGTAVGKLVVE